MLKKIQRAGAVAAVALLSLGLASCSGGQSVADACIVVEKTMNEAVSDSNSQVQSMMSELMDGEDVDFAAAFAPVQGALDEARDKVSNAEVGEKLDNFISEYNSFIGVFSEFDLSGYKEIAALSDLDYSDPEALAKATELQEKAAKIQEEATKLSTSLQEKQGALMETTTELQSVCNG